MVAVALKACKQLAEQGINAALYDMHTIKPIDVTTVINNKDYKLIVTVEEHCNIGGLGSAVAETISSQTSHGKLMRLGTGNTYLSAGSYDYMLQSHGLTSDGIVASIINEI